MFGFLQNDKNQSLTNDPKSALPTLLWEGEIDGVPKWNDTTRRLYSKPVFVQKH